MKQQRSVDNVLTKHWWSVNTSTLLQCFINAFTQFTLTIYCGVRYCVLMSAIAAGMGSAHFHG